MTTFLEFAGLRYNLDKVTLNEVIAPPYDVVDGDERARLIGQSPYNSIRIELPVEEPGLPGDRYEVAKSLLDSWIQTGVLARDTSRCFYGYSMTYLDESGNRRSTLGVLGGLAVKGRATGDIMPHEETMPKPKGDRLFLLRSTRTNLSPIWGLSLASGLTKAIEHDPERDGEQVVAVDEDGTEHRIWAIVAPERVAKISEIVGSGRVVIADGHHRFETSLAFNEEDNSGNQPGGGSGAVFGLIVELVPDQLLVRPIHRVVSGLGQGVDPIKALEGHFALEPCEIDPARLTPQYLEEKQAIALVTRAGVWLARDRSMADAGKIGGGVLGELDSVILRNALEGLGDHEITYEANWALAMGHLQKDLADLVIMIRPVTVDQISRAAHEGVRMPPKTTYFFPKPRTGMVFRPLDD